ncbi:hypothetical protein [Magnetospirillum sp. SS-4]|uniref:hypothetical protein n=1 Tax=Magnetospirillum sp. SS-4 TaxID=2681465 RepID=UPI00157274E4|nr:hypothetical protein [Magnetospirillum sp. SS-4]
MPTPKLDQKCRWVIFPGMKNKKKLTEFMDQPTNRSFAKISLAILAKSGNDGVPVGALGFLDEDATAFVSHLGLPQEPWVSENLHTEEEIRALLEDVSMELSHQKFARGLKAFYKKNDLNKGDEEVKDGVEFCSDIGDKADNSLFVLQAKI